MVFEHEENRTEILERDPGCMDQKQEPNRMNPRLVFSNPDNFFRQGFLEDLWLEQREQM